MIINQIYSIDSCDDVELNIKRGSKLEFRLTYDDSKEIEAIVCIIPGGAEDMNSYIYIQENIKKYSNCGNKDLALEYNKIRSNLGELLRSIQELRSVDDEKVYLIIKNLQKGKEILKEIDGLTLNNVEHLILVRKITTAEGISIINDTSFIAKIAKDLIDAVEIIFAREKVLWDDIN